MLVLELEIPCPADIYRLLRSRLFNQNANIISYTRGQPKCMDEGQIVPIVKTIIAQKHDNDLTRTNNDFKKRLRFSSGSISNSPRSPARHWSTRFPASIFKISRKTSRQCLRAFAQARTIARSLRK